MGNFDIIFDPHEEEEPKKAGVVIGGTPTEEELEDAFGKLFDEWRNQA